MKAARCNMYFVGHRLIDEQGFVLPEVYFSDRPHVHNSQASATRECMRLAKLFKNKQFFVVGTLHAIQYDETAEHSSDTKKVKLYQYNPEFDIYMKTMTNLLTKIV